MTTVPAAPTREAIRVAAEALLARQPARVQPLAVDGARFWLKRVETPGFRMRLQKGDPRRAFEAERRALRRMAEAGAPVPAIAAEGEDWFVLPDSGATLSQLWRDPACDPALRTKAFAAAGSALAALHARGLSHGRPSPRDICWNGCRAVFLDLERYAERRNTPAGHAQDLVILVFATFVETGGPCPEVEAMVAAYRASDPGGVWDRASRLGRRLGWIGHLSRPLRRLRDSRELRAIGPTLVALARTP